MAVAFANIFMSAVESKIIGKSKIKPIEWKRYIDVCSRYGTQTERKMISLFQKQTGSILPLNSRLKYQRRK